MADVFSKYKRSEVMSHIRSRGNKDTEVALARLLRRHKISGWRRQVELRIKNVELRMMPGGSTHKIRSSKFATRNSKIRHFKVRPDFIFRRSRLAMFVDGCFWHGCPEHGTQPKGNRTFWKNKFATNKSRDQLVNRALRSAHWRVLRIWECELARKNEARLLNRRDLYTMLQ
jgi:DNA mismatch endonuclease (patch repair protein)